jgi:Right handed beta helix region
VVGGFYTESLTVTGQVEIRGLTDASSTRIDGGGGDPIFVVESGGALTLRKIQLNNGAAVEGACIRVEGGSVTLDQAILDECDSSEDGGAIWGFQSSITMTGTQVLNSASSFGDGGGLYLDECTLVVDDCLFRNLDADDGYGGAMELVETDATVTRTHFLDADAEAGGAIDVFGGGSLTATGVLFEYNRAWIVSNVMGEGGAIASSGASLQVVNCTFSDNQGELGAGIYFQTADPADTLEIRNNIFHLQGGGALRLDGLIDDPADGVIEYNDFFGNTTLVDGQADPAAFAASNLFVDPEFLGYVGLFPEVNDFHLQGGSPLVDAGDPDTTFDDLDGTRAEMGCYGGPTPLP